MQEYETTCCSPRGIIAVHFDCIARIHRCRSSALAGANRNCRTRGKSRSSHSITPATLTPVGYLQFETGFTPAFDSPEFSSRYSLNEVIKLAVVPRLQVIVASDPIVHFTSEGTMNNRVGDIFLGAQGILYHGEGVKPTLAVSYSHKLYDGGAPEFDFGSPTNSFLFLASADVKGFHYDANVFFTELKQGPVRRGQFGQSLTISHRFLRQFTLAGEIWHFTQPFLKSNAVGNLWSVSYSARK